jgi:hypothetical protein
VDEATATRRAVPCPATDRRWAATTNQAGEITYALTLPESYPHARKVQDSTRVVPGLVLGLCAPGIEPEFKPINDILVNGRRFRQRADARFGGIFSTARSCAT